MRRGYADEEVAAVQKRPEVPYFLHHRQQLASGHTVVPLRPIQGVTVSPTPMLLPSVSTIKASWASG